ncbi:uncharacterized protein VTP21DRAFT_4694 [Calcarisporiella thermophila]|uniref:uncharacterized protein n=1 Tax=Calcarisporiella thermophila TaxID=911321 RepID=UPI003743B874
MTNENAMNKKYTISSQSEESGYWYLRVKFVPSSDAAITELMFRNNLSQAMGQLYGVLGSGAHADVLLWEEEAQVGVLRINREDLEAIWSALTLSSFDGRFDVLASSAFLMGIVSEGGRAWG